MTDPTSKPVFTGRSRIGAWRTIAIVGPPVFVAITGVMMYASMRRSHQSADLVDHSHRVVDATADLLAHLTDAETGQRGYVVTGATRYLQPYVNSRDSALQAVTQLEKLTADNATQNSRADSLRSLTQRKFQELEATILLRQTGFDSARSVMMLDSGKTIMDLARRIMKDLDQTEDTLLATRRNETEIRDRITLVTGIVGLVLSILFALAMSGRLARALTSSEKNRRELSIAYSDLNEQSTQLEQANEELQAQSEELQSQAEQLQSRTDELTAQAGELVAAREEALRASEAKSQFLANMSHELRTPLNAIGGHVQLLEMQLHGPITESQRTALGRVDLAQRHLLGLINDILNLTRIQSGKLDYNITTVDLATVLADVESMIGPQLAANKLSYETRLPHDDCLVAADADKLRQVLINILGNALKFTMPGGKITVEVEPDAADHEKVNLDIGDTGVGIPFDKLEMIFEPFVQVPSGSAKAREGTGLGLAISRDLARGMGGDLSVRSVEGEGSVFTVSLRRAHR